MKKTNLLKRLVAFLTAIVMVLGCVAMNVYAEGEEAETTETTTKSEKWNATRDNGYLHMESEKAGRTYVAYQLLYGDRQDDTLKNIEWGASVPDPDAMIAALKSEKVNGRTNTVQSIFVNGLGTNPTAADVAELIIEATKTTEQADMLAYIFVTTMKAQNAETLTSSDVGQTNGKYVYSFGNVHDGYYLAEETTAKLPSSTDTYTKYMAKVVGPTTISTKEQNGPTVEKKIVTKEAASEGETDTLADTDDVGIGDTVTFKLVGTVPNMDGYNKYFYIMEDVLSDSLIYDAANDNMKVTISKEGKDDVKLTKDTGYYVTKTDNEDGTTTVKIVFKNFLQYKDYETGSVTVYYDATVDTDIVPGNTNANYNKVKITYSNNPSYNYKGYDPNHPEDKDGGDEPDPTPDKDGNKETSNIGDSTWDEVYVFTGALEIIKTDGTGIRLPGAKFKVIPKNADNTSVNAVVVKTNTLSPVGYYTGSDDDKAKVTSDGSVYYLKKADGEFTQNVTAESLVKEYVKYTEKDGAKVMDVNGTLYHQTDDSTVYEEAMDTSKSYEKLPVIYEMTTTPETITSETVKKQEWEGTVGEDGTLTIVGLPVGEYEIVETEAPYGYNDLTNHISVKVSFTYNSTAGATWSYAFDDSGNTSYSSASTPSTGIGEKKIENKKGTTLPSTGGMGTKLFYLLGSILLIGASVLLISKRRMNNNMD